MKINEDALNLKREIDRLTKRRDKLSGEISYKSTQLELICIHNETEIQYAYEAGGYLERSRYINKTVCKICGKIIHTDIKIGGFE